MEQQAIAPVRIPRLVLSGAAFLGAYFLARHGMHAWAPPWHWDIAVMSMPLLVFFWFVWEVQRVLRHFDELQRRIHLEALALALWFALLPLYAICYLAARRHYR